MPVISAENSERLFWLGRYSERVFTGLRMFADKFSLMQAGNDSARNVCFDESNPESAAYSLARAYDNAIVLRDEIGSDTFSYIQLAVYELKSASHSKTPLVGLQKVIDNIAAFWGMADDSMEDEHARNIIKLGTRVERVDIYARTNAGSQDIRREIRRLVYRIVRTGLHYSSEGLERLKALAEEDNMNCGEIVREVEALVYFAS
ncbi:MAG: alpha-E domain-containing protein [Synergistaceae bacterium]|nr:alpha-E domain-containing protein [Synergistaceae bacterium]